LIKFLNYDKINELIVNLSETSFNEWCIIYQYSFMKYHFNDVFIVSPSISILFSIKLYLIISVKNFSTLRQCFKSTWNISV